MKLLFCRSCGDVFSICMEKTKSCSCGKTKGIYLNHIEASYSGEFAVPLGFANESFVHALNSQPKYSPGKMFDAFVIEKECETFTKVEDCGYVNLLKSDRCKNNMYELL